MPPATKRKRHERSSVDSGEGRPSPHRPQSASLAQHDRGSEMRDGGRRASRGGQGGPGANGGRGGRRNEGRDNNPNKVNIAVPGRTTPTPGPMSPPPPRTVSAAPTPTATQASTPTFEYAPPTPKLEPTPFDYTFLTEERLSSWDFRRQEVIDLGKQAIQDEDTTDVSSIFQELIRATVDGRIDARIAGNCVKDILGPDPTTSDGEAPSFNAPVLFLDIFSMMLEGGISSSALTPFAVATDISPELMRLNLDNDVLETLGLTQSTFKRMAVRKATNQLYRQGNYNLLREETEGYSKLVTELFTTSGSEPPTSEVVEDAFERVKGLIGTFDLDVGRVLDITLDVFAAVLIKHFRFFIKLLRVSSWWPRHGEIDGGRHAGLPNWALPSSPGWMPTPEDEEHSKQERSIRDVQFWERAREIGVDAFFELGGRRAVDEETKQQSFDSSVSDNTEFDADREWIKHTGTLPPSGNRVAAQLLGFKLRFYTSEARDDDDALPANLIYLTALLIKIGFISLRDLYPHLWPLDEDMPAVREARQEELAEKERLSRPGGGATNALLMAGALTNDDPKDGGRNREAASSKSDPVAKAITEPQEKDKSKEPQDQKVQLLICLLTIGAIPESLFMLGRFPWLPEAYPELIPLINRILHHSIKDLYNDIKPKATIMEDADCSTKKVADTDQSGVPKGQVRLAQLPVRKQLRWPFPDRHDTNDSTSYRFYWDEWADDIPVCRNVDDFFTLCSTLLNLSGVNIGKDVNLLSKITRIGIDSLRADRSRQNHERWQDLLKRLIVPALSLTNANSAMVSEVWVMLQIFPVSVRYSIYAEWFEGQTSRLPAIKAAFARTKLETLSTMKRISKVNVAPMARALAKIAYSSPGIVFGIALSQIESYTNLTEVVVECAKHFTSLGYDVLVWSLMSALGGKDRNRNNAEFALLPSKWLLALSRFSGKVYKRYSILNLSPILRYVADQLYRGNSTDLVILKELISQMSGIVPDTDFTNAQIHAMTGGEELRKHTLVTLFDKRFESTKTSQRLMRALTESHLSGELLISIAQYRQAAIYRISDADAHIKLLATMMDDTQEALSQYLELLRSNLSVDDFDRQVPGIPQLLQDFGLEPGLAFFIGRSSLSYHRSKATSPVLNGTTTGTSETTIPPNALVDTEGDVDMSDDTTPKVHGEDSVLSKVPNGIAPTEDLLIADSEETSPIVLSSDPFHKILEPIVAAVQAVLPSGSFTSLNPDLYVTFWASALGDLAIPSSSYQTEISRLVSDISEIAKDRTDMTKAGVAAKEVKKKNLSATRDKLIAEFKEVLNNFSQKKVRLLKTKALWFSKTSNPNLAMEAFLEKCLLPRLLLSPSDSEYCFRMVKFLHENAVPYFRTLALYSQIFRPNRLRAIIFACTVREAENLGRFLRLVLMDLSRWHADSAVFEREAWGSAANLPGFAKALDDNGKPKGLVAYDGEQAFKSILLRWHTSLNTALRDCLGGTEWMHIRNAMTVLKSVVEVFPTINFHGTKILEQLEFIASREKGHREDLALTSNAVLVQLKKREPKWVMVQAFGHVGAMAQTANDSTSTSQDSTKQTAKSHLKPTAAEFKPGARASPQVVPTTKPPTAAEVEDGEVDDAKNSKHATKSGVVENVQDSKRSLPPATALESKKADVLAERDRFKAAKALQSTPGGVPSRPDIGRNLPVTTLLDQRSPNLPSRPDAPLPSRDLLDRHTPRHGDRRDGRESRTQDPRPDRQSGGRSGDRPIERNGDRPGDRPGDRLRDFPGNDRRVPDPATREFGRPIDRAPGADRERIKEPPPRWTADSAREKLDKTAQAREVDSSRQSRDMLPPRASGPLSDRISGSSSDRLPAVVPERQELINPERAALISADKNPSRSNSPRRGREEPREKGSSRPQSPRRNGADKDHSDSRRDDRSSRSNLPESYNSPRGRVDEIQPPPAGPRGDRPAERDPAVPNVKPAFQAAQIPARSVDSDHGRLNAVNRAPPDPNFGRLTAPASDIPSGPRDRNGRGNRVANPPLPPQYNPRSGELPRPPTPEKQPPTGPSSGRHPRRGGSMQVDPISIVSGSNTVVSTPAAQSPVTAIHPDRLRQLGGPVAPQPQAGQQPVGIHPDRLKAFGNEDAVRSHPQPHVGNNHNNNRSRPNISQNSMANLGSLATTIPPSGPKGVQSSPIQPGPNGFAAPTGPSSANERAARGGRRQLAGINTMLQQAGQQIAPERMTVRGRGGRVSTGMGPEAPNSGPSTPILPVPPPLSGPPPARQEPIKDLGRDIINPARADLITGAEPPKEDRDMDRSGRRDRKSRRGSRSPGRERESKRGAPDEDRTQRSEYRERSERRVSERGEGEKDRHQSKSSPAPPRELMTGRDSMGGGREGGRDRDRDRQSSGRRDVRERDITRDLTAGWPNERGGHERSNERGGGGRSGRDTRSSGDLRGNAEARRDGNRSTRDEGGRKRCSDEGGMESRGHDKRVRR